MSAASPCSAFISRAISAAALSIAVFSAVVSCAGSPDALRLSTTPVRTVTGPIARPGDAARPVRWISVTASSLAKTVMDQREDGSECRLAVETSDAEIKHGALRGLHPHYLHGALGVCPWSIGGKRNFDRRRKALRALRKLDRGPRMQTDRIDENCRGRQRRKTFGRPAGVGVMHRIPPHYVGPRKVTSHPRTLSPRSRPPPPPEHCR